MNVVVLSCLYFHLKLYFLDCIVTAVMSVCIKKIIKIGDFCVAILILKMEKKGKFSDIMPYYFKKSKNTIWIWIKLGNEQI